MTVAKLMWLSDAYCELEEAEIEDEESLCIGNITYTGNSMVETEPLNGSTSADTVVSATLGKRLSPTVANGTLNGSLTVENMTDEQLRKEMMRQTMSELGKRSAAKRKLSR